MLPGLLTPRMGLLTLCDLFCDCFSRLRPESSHEAHLSTEQGPPRQNSRVPCTHGDPEWPQYPGAPSRQGAQEADPLIALRCESQVVTARQSNSRLKMPAARRLRRKVDFETTYRRGRRLGDALFSLAITLDTGQPARLGMSVGIKMAGSAVGRNRIRRVVRESFRLAQHELPPVDIVVTARAPTRAASNERLRESLTALWSRAISQCAASSRP